MESIIEGSDEFKKGIFQKYEKEYGHLAENGQNPKALFITCCDSRVLPNFFTNTGPGDLFIVRNIGNLVHPYDANQEFHSTAAAIEYAINALDIKDIIVCGHSKCGAMSALYTKDDLDDKNFMHVKRWINLGERAKSFISANAPADIDQNSKIDKTAKISAVFQLDNLMTYPTVKEKVDKGILRLHAWFYHIDSGNIDYYDGTKHDFVPLNHSK